MHQKLTLSYPVDNEPSHYGVDEILTHIPGLYCLVGGIKGKNYSLGMLRVDHNIEIKMQQGKATLRHAGILVPNLEEALELYMSLGFKFLTREKLEVIKMQDERGELIELVQGENWHPHIAVNWYEDSGGNYIEVVEKK